MDDDQVHSVGCTTVPSAREEVEPVTRTKKRKATRCPLCKNWRGRGSCELCRRYAARVKYEDSAKGKARKKKYAEANPEKVVKWKEDWKARAAGGGRG